MDRTCYDILHRTVRNPLSAKGLEPKRPAQRARGKYGWTCRLWVKSRSWLVLIQNKYGNSMHFRVVTKAGAVVTCCHISEPEFVETLLLLREGWQGGKGKQREAWIWYEGYVEEHSVPTVDLQTLTCSHVAVLEVSCLLRTVSFYLMYQLHFETLRIRIRCWSEICHDSIIWIHLVGKRMRQKYCQNLDIPMLKPFTKVVQKLQHIWGNLKECTVSTAPLHHALRKDKKKDKKANPCKTRGFSCLTSRDHCSL